MSIYDISVSVSITPARNSEGVQFDPGYLSFSRRFRLSGGRFSDLAPKIDALQDAIAAVSDAELETPL